MLWCFGVRMTTSRRADPQPARRAGGQRPHVLAGHRSSIGAVRAGHVRGPGRSVGWPGIGALARMMRVIPIERDSLRRLPERGRRGGGPAAGRPHRGGVPGGHHLVRAGPTAAFYPAMFQAAVDAGRPVQPLRLQLSPPGRQRRRPCRPTSAMTRCWPRCGRLIAARRTVAQVHVESLQLPGDDRRELAAPLPGRGRGCGGAAEPAVLHAAAGRLTARGSAGRATRRCPVSWAGHGLSGSRRHHPDAPRRHRGDDGCPGHGGQRLVAARHRPGRSAPDGGVPRVRSPPSWARARPR